MRLMAKEEDIYKLMDVRDRYLYCAGLCLAATAVSGYFLMQQIFYWDCLYFTVVFVTGTILCFCQAWKTNRQVMEEGCCYLELDGESLAVCQPEKDGRYESCRIFYKEMEKIVEGSRRGIPEFYVVADQAQDRESFILLGEEEQMRQIFCVRSLGYGKEEFKDFYRRLRWEVPGKVRVIGTKYQTVWDRKKKRKGVYLAFAFALCYLLPKLLLAFGMI